MKHDYMYDFLVIGQLIGQLSDHMPSPDIQEFCLLIFFSSKRHSKSADAEPFLPANARCAKLQPWLTAQVLRMCGQGSIVLSCNNAMTIWSADSRTNWGAAPRTSLRTRTPPPFFNVLILLCCVRNLAKTMKNVNRYIFFTRF